ncbi:uncharacterized protein LOC116265157 isoform X1 [Nymphaea colorata]|nr:uncharacterized protein LOC116265157 isoform X1 [Nymphaea colorata]
MGEVSIARITSRGHSFLDYGSSSKKCKAESMLGMSRSISTRYRGGRHVRMQLQDKPSSFSSKLSTDLPLYESPQAPFDDYVRDRQRVFEAMFPDKRRSQRLSDEEWRIQMLPIDFFFLSVNPIVDMRLTCKSQGKGYPPGVPKSISTVLALEATRWELRGLDYVLKPSDFTLGIRGALYSEKLGVRSRLKGQLELSVSFVLPPVLELVPRDVLKSVAESVLNRLLVNMKQQVNRSLVSDFREYTKEKIALARQKKEEEQQAARPLPLSATAATMNHGGAQA